MSRISKEEQARREGMAQALRIAKKNGIEGLEADLKMRNAIDLPCRATKEDLDKFSENVDNKAECLAEDYTTWDEQIKIIAEECGIDMEEERKIQGKE